MPQTMNALPVKPLPKQDLEHVLDYAREDLERLRGARLFVTGGTGFFGKWLASSFAEANRTLRLSATLVLLTRDPQRFTQENPDLIADSSISLCTGDVRSFDFPTGGFTHIIHGASGPGNHPLEMFDTIVEGARRTLQCAAQSGANRFLLLSSGAVYGPQPASITHIPETYGGGPDPLLPGSEYGEAKRVAEHLSVALSRANGFEATIARCFTFCGPHLPLNSNFAVGNFIADVLAERPVSVQGDGTPYRSYLYAADLAVWLWALLVRGRNEAAYNVGSDEDLTIAKLAQAVAEAASSRHGIQIAQRPTSGAMPLRYVPSVDRARAELGLEPLIKLSEGITRMLDWLR
jgi:nucleoside-diphosphate-sugar epimerase